MKSPMQASGVVTLSPCATYKEHLWCQGAGGVRVALAWLQPGPGWGRGEG